MADLVIDPSQVVVDAPKPGMVIDPSLVKVNAVQPSAIQDAIKYLPGFLKEEGQRIAGGAAGAIGSLSAIAAKASPVMHFLQPMQSVATAFNALDKFVSPDVPSTPMNDAMTRGIGGAAAFPIGLGSAPVINFLRTAAAGGIGGIGGQLGGDAAGKIDPSLRPAGEMAGNIIGGAGTGFLLGPAQSAAQANIRRASVGLTSADFDTAAANAAQAQAIGAKTATGAEMFPPNSGIMSLAAQTRGGLSNNALRAATVNRPGDLEDLANQFLDNLGPGRIAPAQVANSAAESANGAISNLKDLQATAIRNRLENTPPINPQDVVNVQTQLRQYADSVNSPGQAAAYRAVADAMSGQHGALTSPQELSLALVALKDAPSNPNSMISKGGIVGSVDLNKAIGDARTALSLYRPEIGQALDDFGAFSNQAIRPMQQGPIGQLADQNPLTAGQTPAARLDVLSGSGSNSRETLLNARTLEDPVLTGGSPTSASQIAQALAQQRLFGGETNPGVAVRGAEGSLKSDNFDALLEAAGMNPQATTAPLVVADRLQPFSVPAGTFEPPAIGWGNLIRPFRTIDMLRSGMTERSTSTEVAKLLANPTPEGIRQLQEIAMFDPNVRKMMMLAGSVGPMLTEQK